MASTQNGTGSLTVAGQATAAGTYITVPAGAIVESITINRGGAPQYDDQMDEDGAFHTRITYEKRMNTVTIVLVGVASGLAAGDMSKTNYYVESVAQEKTKAALRETITLTQLKALT